MIILDTKGLLSAATDLTRNVKDFLETGVEVIDPWSASPG
jgi:hypothetical protein